MTYLLQVLFALNSRNGKVLWSFDNHAAKSNLLSVFASQFVHDVDGDAVPDIIVVHGGSELSDPGK